MKSDYAAPSYPEWAIADEAIDEMLVRLRTVNQLPPAELRERAKALPIGARLAMAKPKPSGELHSITRNQGSEISKQVIGADEIATTLVAEQRCAVAQERPHHVVDARILAVLNRHGGVVSAKTLAREARVSVNTARSRLDRLISDRRVESVPGVGYRRVR